jgi:hypothetical protein
MAVKANVMRRVAGMDRNREAWRTEAINGLVVLVVWHAMFVAWFTLWATAALMAYADHTGWGHIWRRCMATAASYANAVYRYRSRQLVACRKDQKGQLTCALAMDILASHGMIASTPDYTQRTIDHMKGTTFDG